MTSESRDGWVLAVRVLAIVCLVLLSISIVQAAALRTFRSELQQARAACAAK